MTTIETLQLGRKKGLSPAATFVLLVLLQEEISSPSTLAELADCSKSNITGLLDTLAKGGFIVRSYHPHDRRAIIVVPTAYSIATFQPSEP